jgi:hypothetical protein
MQLSTAQFPDIFAPVVTSTRTKVSVTIQLPHACLYACIRQTYTQMLTGMRGSRVSLSFRKPYGQSYDVDLVRNVRRYAIVQSRNFCCNDFLFFYSTKTWA